MSLESTVYSLQPAISFLQLVSCARDAGIELRAIEPEDSALLRPIRSAEAPLYNTWHIVIGWPRQDAETTVLVDDAMGRGEKSVVDRLGMAGKLGWFELSCECFDYERSWDGLADERDEVEASYSPEELERMRRAETRYFFRCGLRPKQGGSLLCQVAELVADLTDGFLDLP